MKALLLIDIQQGFEDLDHWGGQRNNPDAEEKCGTILAAFRKKELPVFHVQHCSTDPNSPLRSGEPGNQFHLAVTPSDGEPVIQKDVNSAFIGTDLNETLKALGIDHVVVVGLTTDHCVSTTVRMAANLGFRTTIISDATATFNKKGIDGENYSAEVIHATALASLKDEFATIMTMEELLVKMV